MKAKVIYNEECDEGWVDLSYLGEWTNTPTSPHAIPHETGNSRTYNYFDPVDWLETDEDRRRAYERAASYGDGWCMVVVSCTVVCGGIRGYAVLGGVESDISDEYRAELRRDLRREAFEDWRASVARLRSTWCAS